MQRARQGLRQVRAAPTLWEEESLQTCDQTCSHCARDFFRWWKTREAQMSVPRKKLGETTTFAEAAATSIHAPKAGEPCHCRKTTGTAVRSSHGHVGEVVGDRGYVGLDGRHWLLVRVGTWEFHAPCGALQAL